MNSKVKVQLRAIGFQVSHITLEIRLYVLSFLADQFIIQVQRVCNQGAAIY